MCWFHNPGLYLCLQKQDCALIFKLKININILYGMQNYFGHQEAIVDITVSKLLLKSRGKSPGQFFLFLPQKHKKERCSFVCWTSGWHMLTFILQIPKPRSFLLNLCWDKITLALSCFFTWNIHYSQMISFTFWKLNSMSCPQNRSFCQGPFWL